MGIDLDEKVTLNLGPQQVKQAETQKTRRQGSHGAVAGNLSVVSGAAQASSRKHRSIGKRSDSSGMDALAVRASKKLRSDEHLLTSFAASSAAHGAGPNSSWRGDHVPVKQLVEDFARYLYLPRLRNSSVLIGAIRDGFTLLTWEQDSFAFAESFDGSASRYRGLRGGQHISSLDAGYSGLLVKPIVARKQMDVESTKLAGDNTTTSSTAGENRIGLAMAVTPSTGTGTPWGCSHAAEAFSRRSHPRHDTCRA